jgi:hypothetical protein
VCSVPGVADRSRGARILVCAAGARGSPPVSQPPSGSAHRHTAVSRLAWPKWRRVVHAARRAGLPRVRSGAATAQAVRGDVGTVAVTLGIFVMARQAGQVPGRYPCRLAKALWRELITRSRILMVPSDPSTRPGVPAAGGPSRREWRGCSWSSRHTGSACTVMGRPPRGWRVRTADRVTWCPGGRARW